MSQRGGWALIKGTWMSWLQYRSFFFVLAFGWMVPPLIYLFVWSTAAGQETIGGMTRGEFVAYYLLWILVNQLTYSQSHWTVGEVIQMGGLNAWLLRPLPPVYHALAAEIAGKVVLMAFVIPVSAGLALALRPELHSSPAEAVLFFPALGLSWALRFCWGYWLALLAFWTARIHSLLAVQDALIFILAGMVAPLALLPQPLQAAARALPFRYMVGFPVEVLGGSLSRAEIIAGFSTLALWLAVAVLLVRHTWRSGLQRYTAVGG